MRRRRWLRTVGVVAVVLPMACGVSRMPARLTETFTGPDGLIASAGRPSTDSLWTLTSGSLFRADGTGWTGPPDDDASPTGNGSAVFRMVSKDRGFGDVTVSMQLRVDRFVASDRVPAQAYDGAHVWLRYRSEFSLYAVSVDRRDNTMVVKKKCPGGPSNGGTYVDVGERLDDAPVRPGNWQQVEVGIRDLPDGSVAIDAARDSFRMSVVDRGIGCAALHEPGGVGVRGDNAELRLDDIRVAALP